MAPVDNCCHCVSRAFAGVTDQTVDQYLEPQVEIMRLTSEFHIFCMQLTDSARLSTSASLFQCACVAACRKGGAAEEEAVLTASFDHCPLSAL